MGHWETDDDVTLITRPRRFGKTLNMSMLEKFFSVEYAGRGELFEGLFIWEENSLGRDEAHSGQISSGGEIDTGREFRCEKDL